MEEFPRFPKKWTAFGIVLVSIILPFFFAAFFIKDPQSLVEGKGQAFIFVGEALIILPSIFYARRKGYNMKILFRLRMVPGIVILWAILSGLGISILADELDRLLTLVFTPPDWLTQSMDLFHISSIWDLLLMVGGVAVVAPISEELLFRGFLQTTLEFREQDATKAILITALAFALLHLNTWWIVQIYLFGVVLSYFSWRSQSVLPGMFIHMTINGFSLAFSNLTEQEQVGWYELGGHVSPIWLLVAAAALYFGIKKLNAFFPLEERQSETILEIPAVDDTFDRES